MKSLSTLTFMTLLGNTVLSSFLNENERNLICIYSSSNITRPTESYQYKLFSMFQINDKKETFTIKKFSIFAWAYLYSLRKNNNNTLSSKLSQNTNVKNIMETVMKIANSNSEINHINSADHFIYDFNNQFDYRNDYTTPNYSTISFNSNPILKPGYVELDSDDHSKQATVPYFSFYITNKHGLGNYIEAYSIRLDFVGRQKKLKMLNWENDPNINIISAPTNTYNLNNCFEFIDVNSYNKLYETLTKITNKIQKPMDTNNFFYMEKNVLELLITNKEKDLPTYDEYSNLKKTKVYSNTNSNVFENYEISNSTSSLLNMSGIPYENNNEELISDSARWLLKKRKSDFKKGMIFFSISGTIIIALMTGIIYFEINK